MNDKERLEKVREWAEGQDGPTIWALRRLLDDLNETASEGERCETCGSRYRDEYGDSGKCPDPFHTLPPHPDDGEPLHGNPVARFQAWLNR